MNPPSIAALPTKATTSPTPLGLQKSFGFGDRLGLATPGHFAAARKFDFAPIFAQQSIRELERTQRTAQEVVCAAQTALTRLGYSGACHTFASVTGFPSGSTNRITKPPEPPPIPRVSFPR